MEANQSSHSDVTSQQGSYAGSVAPSHRTQQGWQPSFITLVKLSPFETVREDGVEGSVLEAWLTAISRELPESLWALVDSDATSRYVWSHDRHAKLQIFLRRPDMVDALALRSRIQVLMNRANETGNQSLLIRGQPCAIALETSPMMQPYKVAAWKGFRTLEDTLGIPRASVRPGWANVSKGVPLRFIVAASSAVLISFQQDKGWHIPNFEIVAKLATKPYPCSK